MKKLLLIFTFIACSTFAAKAQSNYVILQEVACTLQYDIYISNDTCETYFFTSVIGINGQQSPFTIPNGTFISYVEISNSGVGCDPGPSYLIGYHCSPCDQLFDHNQSYDIDCCGQVTFDWENCNELIAYGS